MGHGHRLHDVVKGLKQIGKHSVLQNCIFKNFLEE